MAPSRTTDVEQSKANLSSNDSAVLQALFDAESAPSPASSAVQTDATLPQLPGIAAHDLQELQEREVQAIRSLQQQDPDETEPTATPPREAVETAVTDLGTMIVEQPGYASAYVNRAQALRMLVDLDLDRGSSGDSHGNGAELTSASSHCAQLLDDLSRAITLLTPEHPTAPVSPQQARILSNAHTHRAYLLYRASRSSHHQHSNGCSDNEDNTAMPQDMAILPHHLRKLGPERLEEMASWDFQQGGRYGNPVAKQLAVHTNPYAKMCGAIVKDAMKAEIEEWLGRSNGQGSQVL